MSSNISIKKTRSAGFGFIFGAVLACFFIAPVIAAVQQTDQTSDFVGGAGNFGGFVWTPYTGGAGTTGGDPGATSDPVQSVVLSVRNTSGSSNCHAHLRVARAAGDYIKSNNTIALTNSYQNFTFTFTTSSGYRLNNLSYMYLNSGNGNTATTSNPCTLAANYNLDFQSSASDVYSYGTGLKDYTGGAWGGPTTTKDTYFIFNGGVSNVSFANTPTSTCNFYNFGLSAVISPNDKTRCGASLNNGVYTATGTCSVGVAYKLYDGTYGVYPFNSNGGTSAFVQALDFGRFQVTNPTTFRTGTAYDARTYLCDSNNSVDCYLGVGSNSHILAYSNNWEFIANGSGTCTSTYYTQGRPLFSTSTEIFNTNNAVNLLTIQAHTYCDGINKGGTFAPVIQGFCNTIVNLFIPTPDSLNNFVQLRARVANKPPFGYVTVYANSLSGLSSASSTSVTTTNGLQLSTTSGLPVIGTIRTIFGWFLWIVFAFYVYKRFKHFTPNS